MSKKFIPAKEYIHKESIGKEEHVRKEGRIMGDFLEEKYKNKYVDGFRVLFINTPEKAKNKLIFSNYKKETNDIYPFLYLAIQFFEEEGDEGLEKKLYEQGYVPIYLEELK